MKLKANAGKKQSLQPKHNVVGPEKRAAWPAPCYAFTIGVKKPSNFLKKRFHLLQDQTTKPPEILRKPKTNTTSPYPHDPGPSAFSHSKSFNCKAFSTNNPNRQRSWSNGTDPNPKPSTRQPSQSSAMSDATHKWAIAWPRNFSTAGCWWWDSCSISSIWIVYILHPEVSFPAAATKVIQYQYQTFRASSGCFGFANGHAQSWSFASLNFWMWCLLDIGRRCD